VSNDEFEQRMHAWRDAENAAGQAEERVRNVGQAGSDPRMALMIKEASDLRATADRMLAALVDALNDPGNRR
jgi:hypothetical protein